MTSPAVIAVVACGLRKQAVPARAGAMYTGAYHRAARRAAETLVGLTGPIYILSSKYGLLRLTDRIEPYDLYVGDPGSVTVTHLNGQAINLGLARVQRVAALCPRAYTDLLVGVWGPRVWRVLEGTRGIGDQVHRFNEIIALRYNPSEEYREH